MTTEPMRALTVRQPHASLIAEQVKTIETRSWSTKYRGPIAIHAGQHRPDFATMKRVIADNLAAWNAWYVGGLVSTDGSLDLMPLGAVVATANLIECIPIMAERDLMKIRGYDPKAPLIAVANPHLHGPGRLTWLSWKNTVSPSLYIDKEMTEGFLLPQLPFGDYTPGRYAWLLADITKLDPPQPAKGRQGLWNWTPQ